MERRPGHQPTVTMLPAPRRRRASARFAAGARLAGAEQPVAQLGLLLGARVPAGHVGQLVEIAQAEELQELRRRPVLDRPELRLARLLTQPALEERRGRRVGADPADPADLG